MATLPAMSAHSVAETKNKLSELIDRAMAGEEVIITRHGQPVVQLSPVKQVPDPKPITDESIDWLMRNRVGRKQTIIDSGTLLRQMRDEGY